MGSKSLSHVLLVFALLFAQHASTLHALEHINGSFAHQTEQVCDDLSSDCNLDTESESATCLIYHLHADFSAYSLSAILLTEQLKYVEPSTSSEPNPLPLSCVNRKPIRGPPSLS